MKGRQLARGQRATASSSCRQAGRRNVEGKGRAAGKSTCLRQAGSGGAEFLSLEPNHLAHQMQPSKAEHAHTVPYIKKALQHLPCSPNVHLHIQHNTIKSNNLCLSHTCWRDEMRGGRVG